MSSRLPTRVWYLEMGSPAELRPARHPGTETVVARAEVPLGALNAFFYAEVGREHHWVDRLHWEADRWQAYAERPELETWLLWHRGTPAGYAELEDRPDPGVLDIGFFGLLAPFRGQGLGGHLLASVVERAWARGADRVTLNTCELDGAHALAHYRARGFRVVREAVEARGRLPV